MWKGIVCGLVGGLLGGAAVWTAQRASFSLAPVGMTFDQLAATLLAASALLVTIFGVGIAVLALWGYNGMKNGAVQAAKAAAVDRVDEQLKEGEIRTHVEFIVTEFVREGVRDGTLSALLENRIAQEQSLQSVDEGWGDLEGEAQNAR